MIKIIFSGNLAKAAEVRTTQSGDQVISFNVAHTEKYGDGQEKTTWIKCSKWVKAGQSTKVADYLQKGTKVLVEGSPSASAWIQADGSARGELECRVFALELMGSPKDAAPANTTATAQPIHSPAPTQHNFNAPVNDDLPF